MDATALEFKVTYYVGIMLAQGGLLKIMEDQLLFVPRNIEKAMGASDIEIPYGEIKMVEVSGTITESLIVRTEQKAHRFVGSDLQKIEEFMRQALIRFNPKHPTSQPAQTSAPARNECPSCFKAVKPDHNFCPACGMAIKKICASCRKALEHSWKFCASCGATL